ncbi:hypothetical protein FQR65_LT17259 [Abscondita terminalis]|nr:hypothetical protein FQR65_LT17259 [Abscondita terminalis]
MPLDEARISLTKVSEYASSYENDNAIPFNEYEDIEAELKDKKEPLTEIPFTKTVPGSGPRHFTFHPNGIKAELLTQEFSVEGTKKLIEQVAKALGNTDFQKLNDKIDADMKQVQSLAKKPKVLFIYARGNNLMVAEAVVKANPDILFLFKSGLMGAGGNEAVLKMPGVAQTNAGKNKKVISMDGGLASSFGPRLGEAVSGDLKEKWAQLKAETPHLRIRNAAEQLGVSEADLLVTNIGEGVTVLNPDFAGILTDVEQLGKVMALTRNDECVHERKGIYLNGDFSSPQAQLFVEVKILTLNIPQFMETCFCSSRRR